MEEFGVSRYWFEFGVNFAHLSVGSSFDIICAEPLDGLLTTREALPMRRRGLNRKVRAPCIF